MDTGQTTNDINTDINTPPAPGLVRCRIVGGQIKAHGTYWPAGATVDVPQSMIDRMPDSLVPLEVALEQDRIRAQQAEAERTRKTGGQTDEDRARAEASTALHMQRREIWRQTARQRLRQTIERTQQEAQQRAEAAAETLRRMDGGGEPYEAPVRYVPGVIPTITDEPTPGPKLESWGDAYRWYERHGQPRR